MSAYIYEIQGLYNSATYGWEAVDSVTSKSEALERIKEYRDNERVPFRIKRVKEGEGE